MGSRRSRAWVSGGVAVFLLSFVLVGNVLAVTAAPNGDYRFQRTLASSVGGAPALVDIGPGVNTFATEDVDGSVRNIRLFPKGNGVALAPTTGLLPTDHYTIVVLFRLDAVDGWRRIIDFCDPGEESGLMDYYGTLQFYPYGASSFAVIDADEWVQVALTRKTDGTLTGYVDGQNVWAQADRYNDGIIDPAKGLRFFRDDQNHPPISEHSSGAVARIRVWDVVLTDAQIAALAEQPPAQKTTPAQTSGRQGSLVGMTGKNFGPVETVTVKLRDAHGVTHVLGTATTNAAGRFSKSFRIPAAAVDGAGKIIVKGGTSKLVVRLDFTVT